MICVKRKHGMTHRLLTMILLSAALSGCSQFEGWGPYEWWQMEQSQSAPKQQENSADTGMPVPAAKPVLDTSAMEVMNQIDPSVKVFSIKDGPMPDPYMKSNLQPLSGKVVGEGYVATDPSVTVYPPRMPTAVPDLAPMEGVKVDATASLYSAKVRAMAKERTDLNNPPPLPVEALSMDDMEGDMTGRVPMPPVRDDRSLDNIAPIAAEALPPVQEIEVPSRAPIQIREAAPIAPMKFTTAGTRSIPAGSAAVRLAPMQPVMAPAPASVPVQSAPQASFDSVPMPPDPDGSGSFSLTGY